MLRRLTAARLPQNRSRASPFVRFCSSTFLRLLERSAFLYRNRKNVIYNRARYAKYGPKIFVNNLRNDVENT
jgi:hypothetical protein